MTWSVNTVETLKAMWQLPVPLKFKIFAWRLLISRLPSKDLLLRRGVAMNATNDCCEFCRIQPENLNHLFFACNVSKLMWRQIFVWMGDNLPLSIDDFLVFGNIQEKDSFYHNTIGTKIPILPEGDGFDHHKLVVAEISHIIRTHLSEGKPSWKKLSTNQRDSFFDLFQRKEKGANPSLTEFYFRTHRENDQSWVGVHAESAYDKYEQKKLEISSQNPTIPGEDEADSQPTIEMPPDLDIWVESVGKKKGSRVFGLGTASKTLVPVSKKPSSLSSDSQEVDVLRSQVHPLNASLQRQEQEKMVMRQQLHRQEEKMAEANNKISFLMNHLGFVVLSF
ncbi:uncharacterized protein LOC131659110 [Vicia villosa]|uniref:uncharacterized protein LOC131659110 n=1 Tax=Vicia villosa TaxID=3911 RepID=UPI00273ACE4A|nr:uncharacterized protein LOC131659110 [Vicia villosa]